MNEVLKILSIVFFSLTGVGLITSLIIFFKFRISEVIQDLNGTLAQKQIEQMRERALNENKRQFGEDILESGFSETGNTSSTGKTGRSRRVGQTGTTQSDNPIGVSTNVENGFKLGSLQNQLQVGNAQKGTTVLQSNKVINPNFVMIKNIVYINTSEFI